VGFLAASASFAKPIPPLFIRKQNEPVLLIQQASKPPGHYHGYLGFQIMFLVVFTFCQWQNFHSLNIKIHWKISRV
jgi:hypothetical protein